MPGAPDPLYVAARRTLLDALEAVREHLDALVIVGAQAVYIHAGDADIAVAPYTTDGDIAIDPARLADHPLLEDLLVRSQFRRASDVGAWTKHVDVEGVQTEVVVDLLVPQGVGGAGRRAARIPPHARGVARKVMGLEGALVDTDAHAVGALEDGDARRFEVAVAGPGALLVAKVFKIDDRSSDADRRSDKDALDVFRLLRTLSTEELSRRLHLLRSDERSREVAEHAVERLSRLFGRPAAMGCAMAARAASPLEPEETMRAAVAALTQDLLGAL